MKAIVKRVAGLSLTGKADSGHWVSMDTSAAAGGHAAASSPMELVLMALGGCTSMDVLSILAKKRVVVDDFQIRLEAQRAEEHPQVFKEIIIKYIFSGKNISPEAVQRAIELSEGKYCSVAAMLAAAVKITTEYEIVEK